MSTEIDGWRASGIDGDQIASCPGRTTPVIALHCSGADGSQWRKLAVALDRDACMHTPSFIGSADVGHWSGAHAFTLLDEAKPIIGSIDLQSRPVHLVGHSYGGAVALKIASLRPGRIASLSIYEPSAFHSLKLLGPEAREKLMEIENLAEVVSEGLVTGAYSMAAETFVDYWGGRGAWASLRPAIRDAMLRWLPKAPLDFRALLQDDTPLDRYAQISCPVLVMRGEHALRPSRTIAEAVARLAPAGRLEVLPGAGHMGPVTHAAPVAERFALHIRTSEAARAARERTGSMAA